MYKQDVQETLDCASISEWLGNNGGGHRRKAQLETKIVIEGKYPSMAKHLSQHHLHCAALPKCLF